MPIGAPRVRRAYRIAVPDSKNSGTGDPAFGARLKAARETAGMSQAQLAAAIGVEQNTISDYELGKAMPAAKGTLPALARAVGSTPTFLLTGLGDDVAHELQHFLKAIPRKFWRKIGEKSPAELERAARQYLALLSLEGPDSPRASKPPKKTRRR